MTESELRAFLSLRRITACALLLGAAQASAQRPDSAQCRALLSQPVRDSITVTVGVKIRAFDSTKVITAQQRELLTSAIREVLELPRPLPLLIYTTDDALTSGGVNDSGTVRPSIVGAYAGELWPDGHLSNLRVTGGARVLAFDEAFLGALGKASDLRLIPPLSGGSKKPIELRLAVNEIDDDPRPNTAPGSNAATPSLPLFRMRVPVLGRAKLASTMPGSPGPRYPETARRAWAEGKVLLQFVVNADGHGDAGSIQVRQATAREFLGATLDAFPQLRFSPMEIRGCPVPSLVQMPFEFQLRREQ